MIGGHGPVPPLRSATGRCIQDYKSLYAAVAICDNLVDRQRQDSILASLYEELNQLS